MAAYTQISTPQAATLLAPFGLNKARNLRATTEGIENTNYFIDADDSNGRMQPLVLTIFEQIDPQSLPYFVALTQHLAAQNIPVPAPYQDSHGQSLYGLHEQLPELSTNDHMPTHEPVYVVAPRFSGKHPQYPDGHNPCYLEQCAQIGLYLGKVHASSPLFPLRAQQPKGAQWRLEACHQVQAFLSEQDFKALSTEVQLLDQHFSEPEAQALPQGITHGDLFRDNTLFNGTQLSGIIDWYNASHDVFLYDLAIVVNDWCSNSDGSLNTDYSQALLAAYHQQRPFTSAEFKQWPWMLRCAALRFWLSRLIAKHRPETLGAQFANQSPDDIPPQKEPALMQQVWQHRLEQHRELSIAHT